MNLHLRQTNAAAWRGATHTAAATAAFALVHSATASLGAKAAAGRWLGARARNALYRPAYNAVAVGSFAALVAFIGRQPTRTLYHVRGTPGWLIRVGQLASIAYAALAAWQVGPACFAGLPSLWAWLRGRRHVPREPEGQSPPPGDAALEGPRGAFATSRQPLNFVLLPLLWLNPRMTSNLAAFSTVTTLYACLGSLHTESRQRRVYGSAYGRYVATGVRFFLPVPGQPASAVSGGAAGSIDRIDRSRGASRAIA